MLEETAVAELQSPLIDYTLLYTIATTATLFAIIFLIIKIREWFPQLPLKLLISSQVILTSRKAMDRSNAESVTEARETGKELTIVLHGIFADYRAMAPMVTFLKKKGFCVVSIGYDNRADLKSQAEEVGVKIKENMSDAGISKINLIGVSLGGAVARYYIEGLNNADKINKFVTVFAPLVFSATRGTIARRLQTLFNRNPTLGYSFSKEIEGLFSVKNHLALYAFNDSIIGKQYPVDAPIKQVGIPGGHILASFNPMVMNYIVDYLNEEIV